MDLMGTSSVAHAQPYLGARASAIVRITVDALLPGGLVVFRDALAVPVLGMAPGLVATRCR
jgi:hypothetical protein